MPNVKIGNIVGPKGATGTQQGLSGPRTVSTDANNVASIGSDSLVFTPVPAAIPLADSTQSGLLRQLRGNSTDFVDGTNNWLDLPTYSKPQIWYQRTRSTNAVGNPNFEVDQRNAGASVTMTTSTWAQDCWQLVKNGGTTMAATSVQMDASSAPITVPGTNFALSSKFCRTTLTAAQASLAAADIIWFNQYIEGPSLRALISDVHSVQILVRSSVAGLKFGFALRDASATHSLTKLCTIPSANTWTLIPLAALPLWVAGTTWSLAPGVNGYVLSVTLACGSTYTAPVNDTWQNGNFVGAPGQSNFAASAVNSTFDLAFVQHEPGPYCTAPIDSPFDQNLTACQRYYAKGNAYATKYPTANDWRMIGQYVASSNAVRLTVKFPVEMAKAPSASVADNAGILNQVYIAAVGQVALAAAPGLATTTATLFGGTLAATNAYAAPAEVLGQWQADTGW
jgi:hypothetical protein